MKSVKDYQHPKYKIKLRLAAFATLMFLLLTIQAQATYTVIGCVSDDTGYLYTGYSGVNSPRSSYGPAYETSPVVTKAQLGTGMYCSAVDMGRCVIRTKNDCTDCTGPYDYNPSKYSTNYYYEQAGRLKGYFMCPIDDYAGLMLVVVAGLGFFAIRRNFIFA